MQVSILLAFMIATAEAQTASITTFTTLAAYAAAITNSIVISFHGILPSGAPYEAFNPLIVSGVTFSGTSANLTAADYYSPMDYPSAVLLDSSPANVTGTLEISLPSPTYALALDYGQLFGTGPGAITLSNGFTYRPPDVPSAGSTAFVGFVSTTPITCLSYVVPGNHWVIQDLRLSTSRSTGSLPSISLSLSDAIIPAGQKATLSWSAIDAASCDASDSWSGPRPAGGSQIVTPPGPGYYRYTLTCAGSGNPGLQSIVLTVYGPAHR